MGLLTNFMSELGHIRKKLKVFFLEFYIQCKATDLTDMNIGILTDFPAGFHAHFVVGIQTRIVWEFS